MDNVYDFWGRLVQGVLREDRIRQDALRDFSMSTDDSSSTTTESAPDHILSSSGRFLPSRNIYWQRGMLLGGGSSASVHEGINSDGFFFAVKEISLLDQGEENQEIIYQLEQEIALLSQLEHENILQYYASDALRNPSKTSNSSVPSSLTIPSYSGKFSIDSFPTPRSDVEILPSPHVKPFSFNELRNATRNFRPDSLLGEGGFGYVFKGWIDEQNLTATKPGFGLVIAVKNLKPEGFQGHKEWLTEVNYLGQLHHPNLVKLIGYCSEGDKRLLVYEFMPKGSLENHLFRKGAQPLPWATRIKVAIGAARGLSFLHDADVIYRDFKASNILLDSEFNAKLSHVSTQVMGTQGYAAPEYVATGRLTAKSDVYSFGVVLLELLSGRRALDKTKVGVEQNLVDWAKKPYLGDKRKLFRIMDTKLEGRYPQRGAFTAATLAMQCLNPDPKQRPRIADVLAALEELPSPRNARHAQPERRASAAAAAAEPARNSLRNHHHSPLHITPSASPLRLQLRAPRAIR